MDKDKALAYLKKYISTCFGSQDKIFASHPLDEEEAKQLANYAKKNDVSLSEVIKITRDYLTNYGCHAAHIDEQVNEATKFFARKLK